MRTLPQDLRAGFRVCRFPGVVEQWRRRYDADPGVLGMEPRTNRAINATLTSLWRAPNGAQGLLFRPLQILMAVRLATLLIVRADVANLLLGRA